MKGTPRKRFAGATLVVGTLFVLALAVMMVRCPAGAEENLGEHNVVTDYGNYKYVTYLYPNLNQAFYLPKDYEVRFDVHNCKFYKLEYYEHVGDSRDEIKYGIEAQAPLYVTLNFDISFYTPRGELIQTHKQIMPNWWFCVPHNSTSLEYDRMQIRIRNHTKYVRDFRFIVMDPVDPVKGTPIPPGRDIHL